MPRMQPITVNALLFWGICTMAVIGFVQAVFIVFRREPDRESPFARADAPPGYVWALVPETSITSRRDSVA